MAYNDSGYDPRTGEAYDDGINPETGLPWGQQASNLQPPAPSPAGAYPNPDPNNIYGPGGTASNPPYPGATWNPQTESWNPQQAPSTDSYASGGGGSPSGGGDGSLIAPFGQQFTAPTAQPLPSLNVGAAPTLGQAPAFSYQDYVPTKFIAPTIGEAMNDPGYQFTLQEGNNQLKNWMAAHGTFNDSSAAKSLEDYGQNAASTQYGNVWNRAYQGWQGNEQTAEQAYGANRANALAQYNTNYQTQFQDPYQAQFQGWQQGQMQPAELAYTTGTAATAHANDMNYQNQWNQWLQDWNIYKDQRDSTFNKQFATATA